MPSWPRLDQEARIVTYTNVGEWLRKSGRRPTYTDLAYGVAGAGSAMKIWVRKPVWVKRMFVFNGSVANGHGRLALSPLGFGIYTANLDFNPILTTGPFIMTGTNQIQLVDVPDAYLEPGEYLLMHLVDSATAKFKCLTSAALIGDLAAGGGAAMTGFLSGLSIGTFARPAAVAGIQGFSS